MLSNKTLGDEDYALLPCYAKAYKCGCNEVFENEWISLSPPYLRYPHDDPTRHLHEITIWNKTGGYLELSIQEPTTNVFKVLSQKAGLFAGNQTVIYVKCNPMHRRICFDCLRIKVIRDKTEVGSVSVPLELFPGMNWFILPKLIVMPHVTVGNSVEVLVKLPRVENEEEFFIVIRTPETDAFQVTPFNGVLRNGEEGISELIINYKPKEYTTLVYIIEVHFPNVDTAPFDIIIFARSIPGFESEAIMRETAHIATLKPKPSQKKPLEPRQRIRLKPSADAAESVEDADSKPKDLCTPAGVVHFLLRKGGKFHEHSKMVGALGLSTAQEQQIYKGLEKDFHDKLNRSNIHQKNILLQPGTSFYGEEPLDSQPERLSKITKDKEQQILEYEKALGLSENDTEDLTRTKLKMSNQRSLRRVGEDYVQEKPNFNSVEIDSMTDESRKVARQLALTRFVQLAYVVITRYRVNKRLAKLRHLKPEGGTSGRRKVGFGHQGQSTGEQGHLDIQQSDTKGHVGKGSDHTVKL